MREAYQTTLEITGNLRNEKSESSDDLELLIKSAYRINLPFYITKEGNRFSVIENSFFKKRGSFLAASSAPLLFLPAVKIEKLGDSSFCMDHGIKYPYLCGGMARGITSEDIVESLGREGMFAFFGAAGLSLKRTESAIKYLSGISPTISFGFNLIHNPNEPQLEAAFSDLYIREGVKVIEAAAYLDLTLPVVKYRVQGIHQMPDGEIVTPNRVVAKVSRVEVAAKFFSPPPERFLRQLVDQGDITIKQADLARKIPMAQDVTAEADSGGHTDNRPAITLIPTIIALKDRMQKEFEYEQKLRVGAAGGVSTPSSVAAMFSMGAAYVVSGTVNQSCVESGSSDTVRQMLAQASQADVAMAPSADMFEIGAKVQVLKKGTMFPMRAARLYELYRRYEGIDAIPEKELTMLEEKFFRAPICQIWEETKSFFEERNPDEISRGECDAKHKMALIFRWYLGRSSHWATTGEPTRKMDYQVWCGPGIGAFNEWVKGSFLENYENRKVSTVAFNLLYGAAVYMRLNTLRCQGIPVDLSNVVPRKLSEIRGFID